MPSESFQRSYDRLNSAQKKAVDTTRGPVLVLAGPGTGKTQLLSVRAAAILDREKVHPENILILTYTNAAAKAMKDRLAAVIGRPGYGITVDTFHGFANMLLLESADAANYVGNRVQMDDIERMRAIEHVLNTTDGLDEIRPFRAPYTYLKELLKRISELKKDGITPAMLNEYLARATEPFGALEEKHRIRLEKCAVVYEKYEALKNGGEGSIFDDRGRYDFDDMILYATDALAKEPALLAECRERYRYIMVDEYQDTNESQLRLLFSFLDAHDPNLLCVGDDDQSIYRFQGATIGNFRRLKERFPEIRLITLTENYRSTKELLELSSRVIDRIPPKERIAAKTLTPSRIDPRAEIAFAEFASEEEELGFIIEKVNAYAEAIRADETLDIETRAHPFNAIAILVRKRNDILKLIDAFLRAGIPYATDGKEDIGSEKIVRQLLDVLTLASLGPREIELKDFALYKILTADYLHIPHSTVLRFFHTINGRKPKEGGTITVLSEFIRLYGESDSPAPDPADPSLARAGRIIRALLEDAHSIPVHTLLMNFIKNAGLLGHILREYDTQKILRIRHLRALGSFVNMIKQCDIAHPGMGLDEFMRDLKTRAEHDLPIQGALVTSSQEGVRIYTAHGAKGLEFHSVIIPFCLDKKNWPARTIPALIKLPYDLFTTHEDLSKDAEKAHALHDETRLFYVAATRARSNLVFTATPHDDLVTSMFVKEIPLESTAKEPPEESSIARFLETTDTRDPFIGTDAVLRDMIAHLTLNPTRINNFMVCRRKFLYTDILRLPGPKKKSLVFGNCAHKGLEETYRHLQETGAFPPFSFFERAFMQELHYQGVDRTTAKECAVKMKSLAGWFDLASKNPVVPLGLEKKLLVTIGDGVLFTGKYDKVEWEDESRGIVRIVDYKTGKPDKHLRAIDEPRRLEERECDGYFRQLVAYRLLYEKDASASKGRRVGHGSLVFLEPVNEMPRKYGYSKGEYATKNVAISDELVHDLEKLIIHIDREIKALHFEKLPAREDDACGMCDFDGICWGGCSR